MDKLSQAIITMEVHFADKEPRLRAQWETISTVLAEGQKPSTNSGLMQLLSESRDYIRDSVYNRSKKGDELLQKLDAALAQQHQTA